VGVIELATEQSAIWFDTIAPSEGLEP